MKFYEPEVLRFLRQACDEADCLLILDEIMTGFGRIGPMFACRKRRSCRTSSRCPRR